MMSNEEKLVSHYQLKTLLRRDGFGAVYFAEDTRDRKGFILRIIELDHPTLTHITGRVRSHSQRDHPLIEQIRQRVKRIAEMKNSHILPVIEFGEEHIQGNNDIIFYMVSPYEKESLLSYWSEHTSKSEFLALEIVAEIVSQAAEGLFYIHRHGLIHQYVRLSSFMLHSTAHSRKLHIYLTDFWFADITTALLEEGQIAQDLSVYLASEQLTGRAVAASDQYALAILAYELLLGYRLSQVDLSIGLYERFTRQRGAEVSGTDLELARRLDLVLMRALAENAAARYQNIEEFAAMFRAVAYGEDVSLLEEDTVRLSAISGHGQRDSQRNAEIAAATAGALSAGEILQRDTDLFAEQTQIAESSTIAFAAGEARQRASDTSEQQTLLTEQVAAAFAAGIAAGEEQQRETDVAAERVEARESTAAAFATGIAAGEAIMTLAQETDIAEEQTQIIPASGTLLASVAGLVAGEMIAESMEETLIAGAAGRTGGEEAGVLAGGAAGLGGMGLAAGGYAGGGGAGGVYAGGGVSSGGAAFLTSARRRRGRGRSLLVALVLLLLLLFLVGSTFAFAWSQSTATVTLTLKSYTIQNTYLVTATTTTTSGQVQASVLKQTATQSKSGQASGYFAGSHASGFIKFYNASTICGCPVIIPAGTAFTGSSGVTVVTDQTASVASLCDVTVHAHAVIYGPGGNIPVGDIHAAYSSKITATNPLTFSGGQAGQSNALVQQSDIDHLAKALEAGVVQSAQTGLQAQVKSNQHLFAQPVCQTQISSDQQAGSYANQVNVTASATCVAEAYDYSAAVQIVQREVQNQATTYFSDQFVLVNGLQTTVTNSTVIDTKTGALLLAIKSVGKWVYKLRNNLEQSLALGIAGKSIDVARLILDNQIGVAQVDISISGFNQNTLPSDSSKIAIVLKS